MLQIRKGSADFNKVETHRHTLVRRTCGSSGRSCCIAINSNSSRFVLGQEMFLAWAKGADPTKVAFFKPPLGGGGAMSICLFILEGGC